MSLITRKRLFLPAGICFLAFFIYGLLGMTPVGQRISPYATELNALAVSSRHITDGVAAVNFDFVGSIRWVRNTFSSLQLWASCCCFASSAMKPRKTRAGSRPRSSTQQRCRPRLCSWPDGPHTRVGIYTVTHGQITPGGGLQGESF